jgi:hypothetical protein
MEQIEFLVGQPHLPGFGPVPRFFQPEQEVDYSALWQFPTVDCCGARREHVGDDHIKATSDETPAQAAYVLGAQRGLSGSFGFPPRCLSASNHELAYVVDIDERCPYPALSEPPSGDGLTHPRSAGEHQRPQKAFLAEIRVHPLHSTVREPPFPASRQRSAATSPTNPDGHASWSPLPVRGLERAVPIPADPTRSGGAAADRIARTAAAEDASDATVDFQDVGQRGGRCCSLPLTTVRRCLCGLRRFLAPAIPSCGSSLPPLLRTNLDRL